MIMKLAGVVQRAWCRLGGGSRWLCWERIYAHLEIAGALID